MRDFASFTADEPDETSTKVLIDRIEIAEDGDLLLVRIAGSHFLWRMVRRIVGVLAAVGRGELTAAQAIGYLGERSEIPATLTAPASGLFLEGVYYGKDDGPGPLRAVPAVPRTG
jgi:tRNA pseudouridine38-40 synthase